MSVPDFQSLMLPLLRTAADGVERSLADVRPLLASEFGLDETDLSQLLPSGRQSRFANRVAWAKVYLEQARLVKSSRRGHFRITERGAEVLAAPPDRIDISFLAQFAEFRAFRSRRSDQEDPAPQSPPTETATPDEVLESAYTALRERLSTELLERVTAVSSAFFERLVVDLLLAMGYGGRHEGAGRVTGRSGDGGIDGIISEDTLGLESVYIQAKQWSGTVGRPEVQKFVGALHGQRARKGVLITTGTFSTDAMNYVDHLEPKVVLIDGTRLAQLMIDHDVGVSKERTLHLRRLDSDYFDA